MALFSISEDTAVGKCQVYGCSCIFGFGLFYIFFYTRGGDNENFHTSVGAPVNHYNTFLDCDVC